MTPSTWAAHPGRSPGPPTRAAWLRHGLTAMIVIEEETGGDGLPGFDPGPPPGEEPTQVLKASRHWWADPHSDGAVG